MNNIREFINSKLTPQQNHTIANVVMFAGILVNFWDIMQNGIEMRLAPLLIAVFLVGIGYTYQLLFVRCPHCGDKLKGLKNKTKLPDRCPNCNTHLHRLYKKKIEE